MLPEKIVWFAVALELWGASLYVRDIIRGNTKPNLISWCMWMLAPFLGVFFQLRGGAGLSVMPIFMAGFGPVMVVAASILNRKAIWKINTLDVVCGIFSLSALALYALTHNLAISIIFAISSDALAFVPTYIKGWKFPETESSLAYACYGLAQIIGLLIIKKWSFTIYSFGVYLLIANLSMLVILYRKKIFGPSSVSFTS